MPDNTPRLLVCFAHPDDEAFTCGGTLRHYADLGAQVTLVCATRGEAGEIASPELATPETLGQVREQELRAAAELLGIHEVIFLGYRDSGMAGSPDNKHPNAYYRCPSDEAVRHLVNIIRDVRPHVVITFEANGGYGHPDHLTIHHHTAAAVLAAASPTYGHDPEATTQAAPWSVSRLFYTSMARKVLLGVRDLLQQMGEDTGRFENLEKAPNWIDGVPYVEMDVGPYAATKLAAMRCHRTQLNPNNFFRKLSDEQLVALLGVEQFALALDRAPTTQPLSDLFAGLLPALPNAG